MHKREAQFQTRFNQWLRQSHRKTGAFELKQCQSSLPFTNVEPHQINALKAAKHGTLAYKIPDDTRSFKPFDCFALAKVPAYVVPLFQESGNFYLIDIDVFCDECSHSSRKSLTESRAKEIAAIAATL